MSAHVSSKAGKHAVSGLRISDKKYITPAKPGKAYTCINRDKRQIIMMLFETWQILSFRHNHCIHCKTNLETIEHVILF